MPTHRLKLDSPAIDKGKNTAVDLNNSTAVTTDGRGFPRPADLSENLYPNAPSGDGSDIGAYEYQLQPTAASVTIGGRVSSLDGRGLRGTLIVLTDRSSVTRTTTTWAFGFYRFADVAAGQTIVMQVIDKRYQFTPQIVAVNEDTNDLDFRATSNLK